MLIERCTASVAPVRANATSSSPSGIADARTAVRVSTTDWHTPGSVSSTPSVAAAAAKAGTPGVMVQGIPSPSSRRACSAIAP